MGMVILYFITAVYIILLLLYFTIYKKKKIIDNIGLCPLHQRGRKKINKQIVIKTD